MHPQTLRKYERLGLVQPSRDHRQHARLLARRAGPAEGDQAARGRRRHQPGRRAAAALDRGSRAADAAADARRAALARATRGAWRRRSTTGPDCWGSTEHGVQGLLRHARRREDGDRQGNQAGVPEAGAQAPPRRQSRATRPPKPSSRRSTRPTKSSAIRRSGRNTTSSAPTGGMYEQAGAGGPADRRAAWNANFGGGTGGGFRTMTAGRDAARCSATAIPSPTSSTPSSAAQGGQEDERGRRTRGARGAPAQGRDVEQEIRAVPRRRLPRHDAAARDQARRPRADRRRPDSAGVGDGSRVRVAGEGEHGAGGAQAGDLYLRIRLAPHPKFERKGKDLYTTVAIPLTTAVLGGEAEVPTLAGKSLRLKVPATTQNGQVFRLKGHGMPASANRTEPGDLYATVEVQLPKTLTPEQRTHFEALQKLTRLERRRLQDDDHEHQQVHGKSARGGRQRAVELAQSRATTRRSSRSTCSSRWSSSARASCPSCCAR